MKGSRPTGGHLLLLRWPVPTACRKGPGAPRLPRTAPPAWLFGERNSFLSSELHPCPDRSLQGSTPRERPVFTSGAQHARCGNPIVQSRPLANRAASAAPPGVWWCLSPFVARFYLIVSGLQVSCSGWQTKRAPVRKTGRIFVLFAAAKAGLLWHRPKHPHALVHRPSSGGLPPLFSTSPARAWMQFLYRQAVASSKLLIRGSS